MTAAAKARSATVWAIRYGLPGFAIRTAARRGDLIARLTGDPVLRDDPFDAYDQLRARGDLVTNNFISATATHRVANKVLRDDSFLASPGGAASALLDRLLIKALDPGALGPVDPPSLLTIHPPQHTRLRKLVAHAFTPRAIAALQGRIEAVAHELIDRLPADGTPFDLVKAYAAQLPVTVIAEILGVPAAMHGAFLGWGNDAAATLDPALDYRRFRRADQALRELNTWFGGHLARLRREPGDDLLSKLVHTVDDGDQLTDVELRTTALLLLGAGFETTVNLIGNGTQLLLAHRDQLDALRADPSGWAGAVEEVLRHDSPVQITARIANKDTEIAGRPVPNGRGIVVMIGGANRDPDVFADPHTFDVTRGNAREHLAFSAGIHYCLGAQLARLEGQVALRTLFERLPRLRAAGTPVRRETRVLRGFAELPLRC
jgi:cytochrome P450